MNETQAAFASKNLALQDSAISESFSTLQAVLALQIKLFKGPAVFLRSLLASTYSCFPPLVWGGVVEAFLTKPKALQPFKSVALTTSARHIVLIVRIFILLLTTLPHLKVVLTFFRIRSCCFLWPLRPPQLVQKVLVQEAHAFQVAPCPSWHLT